MMYEFKKISKNELEKVIKNASLKIGINEAVLEKDYWVCFVLNYLFSTFKWKDSFTFKGGTSLSKCFHLIQRFSEDIDLILDWRKLGYLMDEPLNKRSNTKQDHFNKEMKLRTETFLKEEFVPIVPDIQKVYPMLFEGDSFMVRTVLPERTFWEKATILHHEANRPKESRLPLRYARHYYDLVCIANSLYKDRAF